MKNGPTARDPTIGILAPQFQPSNLQSSGDNFAMIEIYCILPKYVPAKRQTDDVLCRQWLH